VVSSRAALRGGEARTSDITVETEKETFVEEEETEREGTGAGNKTTILV